MQLTLAAAPRQVEPAGVVTYTVVITNTLADRGLSGLVVSDTLPLELAYWPAGEGEFSYLEVERRLEWAIGQLAAGATLTGTFQAQALAEVSGQVITNTAAIVSEEVGTGGGGQCGDHDHRGAVPGRGLCADAHARTADRHADGHGRAAALPG
ncbi:MAG: DUF11 domain-containing protein [Anaerolineae bacterium]|uniref:hypothetical protein n=1 Tax=Candidatus Amarolinea dominans TaxID=3140696 RepID=UPI003134D0FF|nr:DUF11 domain-containing protein [Anaerolineae bacterium]